MTKAETKRVLKLCRQIQDQLNKTRFEPKTISNNFTIPVSAWTLENGKYTANISAVGSTVENYAKVFFDDSCSEIVTAAKISAEGETFQGGISITAENLPTDSISGSYYIFKEDSFMSKARVNSCNNYDSVFVGATSITSGAAGNVPAPLAGDQNKFLRGNGQWADIPSGGSTGSGDFVINGTSVKGASITGADVSFESDTAKISITAGSGAFTLNGAEVQEVTLQGANYSYDSSTKKASITVASDFVINGTTVKSASIEGAGVSFESDTAKITISSSDNNFTDAYKTKLDSIQAGAEVNVIEGIALNGTNVSIDANKIAQLSISGGESTGGNITINGAEVETVTLTGGLNYSYDSSTKKASISGGDFSLNGDTVKGMNIGGVADVSIDAETGIADVVINSSIAAGVEKVSVLGGEINASINNRTLYLYAPAKPTLADPQFTVPESLTAMAYTEVPVTISRNGDGYISPIAQPGMTWKRKNATEFTLKVNNPGDYLAGMTLTETANYYAAAKNIPVHVTQNEALKILLHFDDQYDLWKNSAPNPATTSGNGTYNAEGKFGGCVRGGNGTTDITDFGARSFTCDFWTKQNNTMLVDFGFNMNNEGMYSVQNGTGQINYYASGAGSRTGTAVTPELLTEWVHHAYCYDATEKVLRCFVNGQLDAIFENFTFPTIALKPKLSQSYYDELRILDGVCQWTENFTPPTEPY